MIRKGIYISIWEVDEDEPEHAEKVADACNDEEKLDRFQSITHI